jgi:nucleoside-diphosphate-sugar epimerase
MRVLVTGASGFVGKGLLVAQRDRGHEVTAASRSRVEKPGIFYIASPELGPAADWVNNTLAEGDLLAGMRKPHEKYL